MLALLFPGQGAQTDGDRAEVARLAPDLLWQSIEALGEDPFARAAESTRFAQPALFITSIARYRAAAAGAASHSIQAPAAFAGHSLGELSALVAAGALSLADGLMLVIERGRLMAEAPAGAMVAVRGDAEAAQPLAEAQGWVVANDNAPGQVVLSGEATQTDALMGSLREAGLRSMRLPVTGAFHSPLMTLAAMSFAEVLGAVEFSRPSAPVYCCATAAPFEDPRAQLAGALTAPVRWRELLGALQASGIDSFADVGPGQVVDGLVRRTLPGATRVLVEVPPADASPEQVGSPGGARPNEVPSTEARPNEVPSTEGHGAPDPSTGRFARPTSIEEPSDVLA